MKHVRNIIIVLFIAAFLRLFQLGSVPPSPDWDEAALGYNAYSILKTGRDEYGNFLPLSIRSFDDYKPPLYTYLTVPSVALFGLNTWSTRLPSVVMGLLAVLGTYVLVRAIFRQRSDTLPFVASLLLAISPWHIQFSRIAFEANTGVTLNIWGAAFFLMGMERKRFLPISAFLFGLALYAYHSERVFAPLLVIFLTVLMRRIILKPAFRRTLIISILVGVLTAAPLATVLFNKTAMLRLRGTSSFTDQTGLLSRTISKLEDDIARGDRIGALLDNRRLVFAKTIVGGYLSHASLKWLFLTGDNPRHHAPDMGLLYLWELPFLAAGLYLVAKYRWKDFSGKLMIGWLILAPVAAAPTTGLPHAIRTLVFLPMFQIITAYGLTESVGHLKRRAGNPIRMGAGFLLAAAVAFNISYYLVQYFFTQNREYSQYWQYGYEQAVAYTESVKDRYDRVVVSTGLEQSYMFFLFHTKFDPRAYLALGGTKSGGFAEHRNAFDKYEFRALDWQNEKFDGRTLYVGSPTEMPHGNNAHIQFLDGTASIEIKDRKD